MQEEQNAQLDEIINHLKTHRWKIGPTHRMVTSGIFENAQVDTSVFFSSANPYIPQDPEVVLYVMSYFPAFTLHKPHGLLSRRRAPGSLHQLLYRSCQVCSQWPIVFMNKQEFLLQMQKRFTLVQFDERKWVKNERSGFNWNACGVYCLLPDAPVDNIDNHVYKQISLDGRATVPPVALVT